MLRRRLGEGGDSSAAPVVGATPRTSVLPGESLRVIALVPAKSGRDYTKVLEVGDTRGGQMCLRAERQKLDEDNDAGTDRRGP